MGSEPFWGVGQQAGNQVMLDTQLGGYHTIWSPLCACAAALGLHQALLRKWKEAFGMQSNPCIC